MAEADPDREPSSEGPTDEGPPDHGAAASAETDADATSDAGEDAAAGRMSDAEVRDELPAELDAMGYAGVYQFPNNNRRRIPGILYLVIGAACTVAWLATRNGDPVLVNEGFLWVGIGLIAIGIVHLATAWPLSFDEHAALETATRTAGFPAGHASAQLGWRGFRSRPTWRILLYSTEEPPRRRGLVLVDAVDGEVLDSIVEDNPEDWSQLRRGRSAGQS